MQCYMYIKSVPMAMFHVQLELCIVVYDWSFINTASVGQVWGETEKPKGPLAIL